MLLSPNINKAHLHHCRCLQPVSSATCLVWFCSRNAAVWPPPAPHFPGCWLDNIAVVDSLLNGPLNGVAAAAFCAAGFWICVAATAFRAAGLQICVAAAAFCASNFQICVSAAAFRTSVFRICGLQICVAAAAFRAANPLNCFILDF